MARVVEMPKLSPTMEEGQIAAWHAKEGDRIEVDQVLAEVETDKATMEFRSFDRGVLLKILAEAGTVVKLGDPVAIIGEAGEDVSELVGKSKGTKEPPKEKSGAEEPPKGKDAPKEPPKATESKRATAEPAVPAARPSNVDATGRLKASPYVRKVARDRGLDLRTVTGSGPGGRIVARDLEGPAGATTEAAARTEPTRKPLSMMRKTIARRLTESKQTVPHFYLTIDVNAGALVDLRTQLNADLATLDPAPKVSFNDLVIKAAAIALVRVPTVNASFTPEALVYHHHVDISVAVAIDDGLVTPVVRAADRKNVLAIAREVRDLAGRAREKKLKPDEMSGGTFSVSNLGMFGIDEFAAVINPPEGAILAVGGIRAEPVVEDGDIVPGHRMKLTLSCDHRVVDGAVGAQYLAALRSILEAPTQILAY
jgi:pyruvate dehydrogenase E2 component (dihydrolipoyllysine-residue acetyltransferase)